MKKLYGCQKGPSLPPRLRQLTIVMKITAVFLLAFSLGVNAKGFSQTVTFTGKNVSLEGFFSAVERQTGYTFFYNDADVGKVTPVTISLKKVSLETALEKVLRGCGLSFSIQGKTIFIRAIPPAPVGAATVVSKAEAVNLHGRVTDEMGAPLIGVSVALKGTSFGTITNMNGDYTLTLPNDSGTLVFSYIGYQPKEVLVNGRTVINIELSPSAAKLNQLVVVGYGSERRKDLTGAVSSVNMNDIQGVPIANTASALEGRLPGVTISSFSNQPGKNDPQIRIRGIGTLNNNNPLVIIDGVPDEVGALGDLSPDDIASISVLKDAASASIYGVRAANGIILVTTKRGHTGKPRVFVRETMSWQKPLVKPDYMNAYSWATAFNDFSTETGAAPVFTDVMLQKIKDQSDPDHFSNTDWFDVVYQTAPMHNHYVSVSGGSDATKYLVSGEYQNQKGVMVNTGSDRIQMRANLDSKISKAVSFGLNIRGYKQKINEPIAPASGNDGGDNGINRMISGFTRPTVPAMYSFGEYGTTDGSSLNKIKNPLSNLYQQEFNTDAYRFDGKIFGEVKFLKDFSFTSSLAVIYTSTLVEKFSPSTTSYGPDDDIVSLPGNNSLSNSSALFTRYINENLLRYNKKIGRHDIKVLVGQTIQHDQNKSFSASVKNLPSNTIRVIGASSDQPSNDGSANAFSLQSFLGRINYTFNDKYLLELNARMDGTSRLPMSEQYPIFPSASAGWLISEEPFLKGIKGISLLKVRASWGKLGNQEIGNYAFVQNYNLNQDYVFGDALSQGVAITSLANANIRWETTEMADIGLDAEFFDGRLGIVVDYFNKNTSNILFNLPIPLTLGGLSAPPQNSAKVNNKGLEIAITHAGSLGDFHYQIGVNGSYIKNKVISLGGEDQVINSNTILIPGSPIDSYYGYISEGIIRTTDQLKSAPQGLGSVPLRLGDISYEDLNGDGKITTDDRTIIGNPFPKFSYGLTMGGSFRGVDINLFFQGISGINRYYQDPASMGFRQQKLAIWNNRYTESNPGGILPRYGNATNNNAYSSYGAYGSYGLQDGSYLRLKNIELGYTFPGKMMSVIGMSNLKIYFSGVNLLTWTKVNNYDVEKDTGDDRSLGYLSTKNFSFGLSATF